MKTLKIKLSGCASSGKSLFANKIAEFLKSEESTKHILKIVSVDESKTVSDSEVITVIWKNK